MATAADLYKQLGITGTLNLSPEESQALTNASVQTQYKYNQKEAAAYKSLYDAQDNTDLQSITNDPLKSINSQQSSGGVTLDMLKDLDKKLFESPINISPQVNELGKGLTEKLYGEGSYDKFSKLAQYDLPAQGGDYGDATKATLPFGNATMDLNKFYDLLLNDRKTRQTTIDALTRVADGSYDLSKISDEERAGKSDDEIRYRAQRTLQQISVDKKDKSTKAGDKFLDFTESFNQSLYGPIANNLAIQGQKAFRNDTKEQDTKFAENINTQSRIDLANSAFGGKQLGSVARFAAENIPLMMLSAGTSDAIKGTSLVKNLRAASAAQEAAALIQGGNAVNTGLSLASKAASVAIPSIGSSLAASSGLASLKLLKGEDINIPRELATGAAIDLAVDFIMPAAIKGLKAIRQPAEGSVSAGIKGANEATKTLGATKYTDLASQFDKTADSGWFGSKFFNKIDNIVAQKVARVRSSNLYNKAFSGIGKNLVDDTAPFKNEIINAVGNKTLRPKAQMIAEGLMQGLRNAGRATQAWLENNQSFKAILSDTNDLAKSIGKNVRQTDKLASEFVNLNAEKNLLLRKIEKSTALGDVEQLAKANDALKGIDAKIASHQLNGNPLAQKMVDNYRAVYRDALETAVSERAISREAADALLANSDYIGIQRKFAQDELDILKATKDLGRNGKQMVKKLDNIVSGREILDPMETLVNTVQRIQRLTDTNTYSRLSLEMLQEVGAAKRLDGVADDVVSGIDQADNAISNLSDIGISKTLDGKMVIKVLEDGVPVKYELNNPELYKMFANLDRHDFGIVTDVMRRFNRFQSASITGLNPVFAYAKNPTRDFLTQAITSPNIFKSLNPLSVIKGISPEIAAKMDGVTYYDQYANVDDLAQQIRRMKRADKSLVAKGFDVIKNPKDIPGAFVKGIEEFNKVPELAIRSKIYDDAFTQLKKQGLDDVSARFGALTEARRSTVDFSAAGTYGRQLNAWFKYSNAKIQGAKYFVQIAAERPVTTAMRAAALIAGPVAMTRAILSDDHTASVYNQIPDWVKLNNLVLIRPDARWNEEQGKFDGVITVPLGESEAMIFGPIAKLMTDLHNTGDVNWRSIGAGLAEDLLPLPYTSTRSDEGIGENMLANLSQMTLLGPALDMASGTKQFSGTSLRGGGALTGTEADNTTSNSAFEDWVADNLGISPAATKYIFESIGGTSSKYLINAVDNIIDPSKTGGKSVGSAFLDVFTGGQTNKRDIDIGTMKRTMQRIVDEDLKNIVASSYAQDDEDNAELAKAYINSLFLAKIRKFEDEFGPLTAKEVAKFDDILAQTLPKQSSSVDQDRAGVIRSDQSFARQFLEDNGVEFEYTGEQKISDALGNKIRSTQDAVVDYNKAMKEDKAARKKLNDQYYYALRNKQYGFADELADQLNKPVLDNISGVLRKYPSIRDNEIALNQLLNEVKSDIKVPGTFIKQTNGRILGKKQTGQNYKVDSEFYIRTKLGLPTE